MEPECKVDFLTWYQTNKITADRIINDCTLSNKSAQLQI